MASGEYVAILNSDDRYHPERLLKVFHKMRQNQSRFAFTQVSHIDEYGRPHPYHSHYLKLLAEIDLFPTVGFALLLNNLTITTEISFSIVPLLMTLVTSLRLRLVMIGIMYFGFC